jgi:hypothetical protein
LFVGVVCGLVVVVFLSGVLWFMVFACLFQQVKGQWQFLHDYLLGFPG